MREPRRITRVELSGKNHKLRWIAVIALFLIGVIGITVGFMNLLNKDAGWQRVQVTPQERNYSENFILQYHFSGSGADNKSLNQKLESVYGDACVNAYRLFTPDEEFSGIQNVYYINRNPNAVITVDPVLYAAFEKLAGTPYLYLGPVYEYYYGILDIIFGCYFLFYHHLCIFLCDDIVVHCKIQTLFCIFRNKDVVQIT